MTKEQKELFKRLSESALLGLTVYGEARGEIPEGRMAVAQVILNRSRLWKQPIKDVCLATNQFSCFLDGDPNLPKLVKIASDLNNEMGKNDPLMRCMAAADNVIARAKGPSAELDRLIGDMLKKIDKATFYKVVGYPSKWFTDTIKAGKMRQVAIIGRHEFFEETKYA